MKFIKKEENPKVRTIESEKILGTFYIFYSL